MTGNSYFILIMRQTRIICGLKIIHYYPHVSSASDSIKLHQCAGLKLFVTHNRCSLHIGLCKG